MAERNSTSEHMRSFTYNQDKILEKLNVLELKLKLLKEFKTQSTQLKNIHKELLLRLISTLNKINEKHKNQSNFLEGNTTDNKIPVITEFKDKTPGQISKNPKEFLFNLEKRQEEIDQRKSNMTLLKTWKQSVTLPEHTNENEIIKKLELENDELNERILEFVIHNSSEGSQTYKELINKLEIENKEMGDRIEMLKKTVSYMTQTNMALNLENKMLKNINVNHNISFENEIEDNIRNSLAAGRYSAQLPEEFVFSKMSFKTSSMKFILDMEADDKLSIDKESADSFDLDKQLANWRLDEADMQRNVHVLERRFKDMEVIEMKLNLIKRFVRKHGTKYINRNTLIDPSLGMGLWR